MRARAAASIRCRVASVSGTCTRDDVRLGEQLRRAARRRFGSCATTRMPSASASRPTSRPIRPKPTRPSVFPARPVAEHGRRLPRPRLARAHEPVALGDAPDEREQERERELGGRRREHVRRVRDDDAALRRRREVDVVVADRVLRHDAQLRAGGVQQLGVDGVGRHRHEPVRTRHVHADLVLERRPQRLLHCREQRPRRDDAAR